MYKNIIPGLSLLYIIYRMDLNFRGTKLSRMAVEPRKPRKFSTAKIKVHTVYHVYHVCMLYISCISCTWPISYTGDTGHAWSTPAAGVFECT